MVLRRLLPAALSALMVTTLATVAPAVSAAAQPEGLADIERFERIRPDKHADRDAHDPDTVLVRFAKGASEAARSRAVEKRGAKRVARQPGLSYELVRAKGRAKHFAKELKEEFRTFWLWLAELR